MWIANNWQPTFCQSVISRLCCHRTWQIWQAARQELPKSQQVLTKESYDGGVVGVSRIGLASCLSSYSQEAACFLSFEVHSTNSVFRWHAIRLTAGLFDCENIQNYTVLDSETMDTTTKTICKTMFSIWKSYPLRTTRDQIELKIGQSWYFDWQKFQQKRRKIRNKICYSLARFNKIC